MQTLFAKPTRILKDATYKTEIAFFHVAEIDQATVAQTLTRASQIMSTMPGFVALNVLSSTDGTRVCAYNQWQNEMLLVEARAQLEQGDVIINPALIQNESGQPKLYDVHYTDDRSADGFSVISQDYSGVMFINEITTIPGPKQFRLLELVVANNEKDSLVTPGYRSANFHRSIDGTRAVNYSLWDTEAHLIEAISAMAGEDVNLEETINIAAPDFRFYTLAYAAHA